MSKRQNYLEAIDTLLAIINNEELNVQDFNQLYFFIASRHKAEPINLFWKLKESVNCHVSSVSDFKCALEDLKAALEENGYGEHSTTDIEDVLYNYSNQ